MSSVQSLPWNFEVIETFREYYFNLNISIQNSRMCSQKNLFVCTVNVTCALQNKGGLSQRVFNNFIRNMAHREWHTLGLRSNHKISQGKYEVFTTVSGFRYFYRKEISPKFRNTWSKIGAENIYWRTLGVDNDIQPPLKLQCRLIKDNFEVTHHALYPYPAWLDFHLEWDGKLTCSCDPGTAFDLVGHHPLLGWDVCEMPVAAAWECGWTH